MAAVVGARVTDGCERVDFGVLNSAFDGRVLHPRPWTVIQATWAAELAADVPAGPILEALAPLVERRSLVVRTARVVDDERAVALVGRGGDNP